MAVTALQDFAPLLDITQDVASGGGSGTVTNISAGAGITLTPNPITSTGTVAIAAPVTVPLGGTGVTTLTAGYVKANGVNPFVSQAVPIPVSDGGTGAITLTGLLQGNGVGPITGGATVNLATQVTGILPYANGGTNTSTAFTPGSMIFAGATSFAQDNANIFYDFTNKRFGVGSAITGVPTADMDIAVNGTSNATPILRVRNGSSGNGASPEIRVSSDAQDLQIRTFSSGYVGTGIDQANQGAINVSAANGSLALGAIGGNGVVRRYTGGSTSAFVRETMDKLGNVTFGSTPVSRVSGQLTLSQFVYGRLVDSGGRVFNVDASGAIPDGKSSLGTISNGSTTLTISGGDPFVSTDVNKNIWLFRAGAAGGTLKTTITAFTSSSQVTINAAASASVFGCDVMWGTDNTTAFQNAASNATTVQGGAVWVLELSQGRYIVDGAAISIGAQNVTVRGQGAGATILMQASLTAATIEYVAAGEGESITDMSIFGPGTASTSNSACSWTAGGANHCRAANLLIRGFFNGIVIGTAGLPAVQMREVEIFDCVNDMVKSQAGIDWVEGLGFSVQLPVSSISINNGSSNLTASGATFNTRDIGKRVTVTNAGAGGTTPLVTTITAVASTTSVTVGLAASATATTVAGTVGFNTATGIHLTAGLCLLSNIDLVGQGTGMLWDPGTNQAIRYSFIDNLECDSCFDIGFRINPSGTGTVQSAVFQRSWFASSGNQTATNANGIFCSATQNVSNIKFIGCRIVNNSKHGVFLNAFAGGLWEFFDCTFDGNGWATTNTYYHINANVFTGLTVQGCKFQAVDFAATTTNICVALSSVIGQIIITGNTFNNTTSGIVENATTAAITTKDYSGNLGTISVGAINKAPSVLFTQTADATTTANTLTTILGTGVGSLTLPANLFVPGRMIRGTIGGYCSTADGGAGTKTLTISLGGTTVATGASGATFQSILNQEWIVQFFICCRTTGAPGTVQAGGQFMTQINNGGASQALAASNATTNITTTGTLVLDVKLNNGDATGVNKSTFALIEAVGGAT